MLALPLLTRPHAHTRLVLLIRKLTAVLGLVSYLDSADTETQTCARASMSLILS